MLDKARQIFVDTTEEIHRNNADITNSKVAFADSGLELPRRVHHPSLASGTIGEKPGEVVVAGLVATMIPHVIEP
jgi:hypothetical protein